MKYTFEELFSGVQYKKLFDREFEPLQKEYDLCKIDMQILFYLYSAGEKNTSKDIVELNMFTKGHISQALSRLQKKKLIVMVQDQEDRRCMHIIVNRKQAEEIVDKVRETYEQMNEIAFQGITEEEIELFRFITDKIKNNIKRVII